MRATAAGSVLVLMVLAIFLVRPAGLADLDSKVSDLLSREAGPGTPSGHVVIVEIDEKSLEQFGRWPWPRDLVARLSRALLDQGAATVALDMMFPQVDGAHDGVLAEAIAHEPVVVGYALEFDGRPTPPRPCPIPQLPIAFAGPLDSGNPPFFQATGVICSVPEISEAAPGGFINAAPDRDGAMRHVALVVEYADRYYPSLALAAVSSYWHPTAIELMVHPRGSWRMRLDNHVVPLETQGAMRLRFRGPRRQFTYLSAADILNGRTEQRRLQGNIAIVGGTAQGMGSWALTPVDPQFPEIEIQATAIDDLLQGDSFYRPDDARVWELALALLAGLISTLFLARWRFLWGAVATLVLAAGIWAVCVLVLAKSGVLVSPLAAMVALACTLPMLSVLHYLQQKSRADQTQHQLVQTLQHSREVLRQSEARYRRLVENVNDAIIMDDVAGRLVFANRRFREWFGVKSGETGNLILEHYVAPEWRAELRGRHDRRMRGESVPDHFEFEGIRSDGTRVWMEALVTNVEEEGRIVGSQAALRDTTERKRMEAQYLQAQKMESVGRLAGGVAHDFNNLLTVINGYSGILLARMAPEDPLRGDLEEIRKAGERAADLTQKLLAFSRKQLVRPRPLDLNLIVAEVEKMFERVIGEDIQFVTRLSPHLGQVVADPGQVHQVLMNLVVNARDAMPNGGKVAIETRNSGPEAASPYVYLAVSDTGTGMSDDVKQHLFEPFFTTKDQGKGTGLGLATVYGIVHQSGGRIEVTSALGHGATIHIYLPRIKPGLEKEPDVSVTGLALQGSETLLLVEDQDAVRQFVCVILEGFGYVVMQAANGPDAIVLAERHLGPIHLLITDIILPVMDGRVLAENLGATRPEMKVLYISGYSNETISRSNALHSDLAFLQKPFSSQQLGARVREILKGGETRRRTAAQ